MALKAFEIVCCATIGQMYRCHTTESGRPSSEVGGGDDMMFLKDDFLITV
jgi:hypothetical protein